jgi:hypothetical protein
MRRAGFMQEVSVQGMSSATTAGAAFFMREVIENMRMMSLFEKMGLGGFRKPHPGIFDKKILARWQLCR